MPRLLAIFLLLLSKIHMIRRTIRAVHRGIFVRPKVARVNMRFRDAIKAGRYDEAQRLIDAHRRDINIDSMDRRGWTLMHHAANRGDIRMARFLRDRGANMEAGTFTLGYTPYGLASNREHADFIREFYDSGYRPESVEAPRRLRLRTA